MNLGLQKFSISLAALVLGAGFVISSAVAADKAQTFKGEVSDSMCGKKHMMEGDAAGCTHACVSKGSSYALVVGDKVYALDTKDKATLDQLDKLAGKQARVKGTENGDTIAVSSVVPGQ
jgi:hypothetical protein